ncbi:MAG TPA: acyltransferase family protein [Opitutaceae bacterium]|nr:acyltransferase family protein [Opitutaceae bacterium]
MEFRPGLQQRNGEGYLAPLDGIRAVAILAVLIFHLWPPALSGGFAGVDVFFVLSGFLITSVIRRDLRHGSFSLKEFYLRRIQRLLPNAVATVLGVLFLWTWFMPPGAVVQPAVHGLWSLLNLSNFYVWKYLGGYWGNAAEWAPLTHFWSLGVEEQFYLLFPGALLLLQRLSFGRLRFWLLLATAISFCLCLHGTFTRPTATFYLLPTRLWELLLGAVIALRRDSLEVLESSSRALWSGHRRETLGWIGLALILIGFLVIDDGSAFPGWVVLLPTMGTALLLESVADGETRLSRLLSIPFLAVTGKLSYSLYLWHWPLIIFGKVQAELYGLPALPGALVGGGAGVLLAWAAYHFVEQPLRRRGAGRRGRLIAVAAGFGAVAVGCGILAIRPPVYDPGHRFDRSTFSGKRYDAGRAADSRGLAATARYADIDFPVVPPPAGDPWRTGGIVHRFGSDRPSVVVLGSSHALMYARVIDELCREQGLSVAFLCVDEGTPAFFETTVNPNFPTAADAREFDETRKRWLKEWRPEAGFLIDRWDARDREGDFDGRLRDFLREVTPLAGRLFFVSQIPVVRGAADVNLRGLVSWRMRAEKNLPPLEPDAKEDLRRRIDARVRIAAKDFPNLSVLPMDERFRREDGGVRYAEGRQFFYADDNHLTDAGSEQARGLFQKALSDAHAAAAVEGDRKKPATE